jgi:hypothetical protein
MMPGVTVADIARKHGTTRWQDGVPGRSLIASVKS